MKIWISKNSEVPVWEQICTQMTLGITSGDLAIGSKLPSTQEIARRYRIHANTVSNAYQKLARNGWIEFKKGSGFFVREIAESKTVESESLEALFSEFLDAARESGFSKQQIREQLQRWLSRKSPERIVLIEPDKDFRDILVDEISRVCEIDVIGVDPKEFEARYADSNSIFVGMSDEKAKLQNAVSPDKALVFLNSNSIADSLVGKKRPSPEDLIAVVSCWDQFLIFAKTILLAAEIDPESLIFRSTRELNWQKGLDSAALIICDSLTEKTLVNFENVSVFPLIAEESLKSLQKYT